MYSIFAIVPALIAVAAANTGAPAPTGTPPCLTLTQTLSKTSTTCVKDVCHSSVYYTPTTAVVTATVTTPACETLTTSICPGNGGICHTKYTTITPPAITTYSLPSVFTHDNPAPSSTSVSVHTPPVYTPAEKPPVYGNGTVVPAATGTGVVLPPASSKSAAPTCPGGPDCPTASPSPSAYTGAADRVGASVALLAGAGAVAAFLL